MNRFKMGMLMDSYEGREIVRVDQKLAKTEMIKERRLIEKGVNNRGDQTMSMKSHVEKKEPGLSERHLRIIEVLKRGKVTKEELADELGVSLSTCQNYLYQTSKFVDVYSGGKKGRTVYWMEDEEGDEQLDLGLDEDNQLELDLAV